MKDPYKKGTKPSIDPDELTPESFLKKLMKQTGLTKEELFKKLDELSILLKKK